MPWTRKQRKEITAKVAKDGPMFLRDENGQAYHNPAWFYGDDSPIKVRKMRKRELGE
jgi:hypothetical protein